VQNHLDWLGWKVKDKATGFTGVVSTVGFDLYGCIQGIVVPEVTIEKASGAQKQGDPGWFDLTRLEKVGKKRVMDPIAPREQDAPGGYDKPTR